MKYFAAATLFFLCIHLSKAQELNPVVQGKEGQKAFDDLGRFYKNGEKVNTNEALAELASADENKRKSAGKMVYALFAQSLADEENGRAPWKQLPYFGGGQQSDAREFRKTLSEEFGNKVNTVEALQAAQWLIDKEIMADFQAQGIKVIRRIKSPETNKIIEQIITKPHSNRSILLEAIDEAGIRKLTSVTPALTGMIHHYRKDIRDAVEKVSANLGFKKNIESFDPAKSFQHKWMDSVMTLLKKFIMDPVPTGSYWIELNYKYKNYTPATLCGWYIGEDTAEIEIYDYSLQKIKIPKKHCTVKKSSLDDAVKDLTSAEEGHRFFHRSFVNSNAGNSWLPFLSVATWCHERKMYKEAAKVLLPLIEGQPDDNWFIWNARDCFGHLYHNEMLLAYSQERDYAKTIGFATHMSKPEFEGYMYQERCKILKSQLQSHPEDFKTFVLPKPEEWKKLQSTMPRNEQLIFLADRLRLLNCIQPGQPAGVSYYDDQFDAPGFQWSQDENVKLAHGVVNPYRALLDMNLAIADIPVLLPYIDKLDYMPTFDYWRDFHYTRNLHQVNWAVVQLINVVTIQDVLKFREYWGKDSLGKIKHKQEFLDWCAKNASVTAKQSIQSVLDTSTTWDDFDYGMDRALKANYTDLIPSLIKAVDRFSGSDDEDERGQILSAIYKLGSDKAVDAATAWLKHTETDIRFYASLILIEQKTPNINDALAVLKPILESDHSGEGYYPAAIRPLLICGLPEAFKMAEGILDTKSFAPGENYWYHQSAILRRLFLAKSERALLWLQKGLENPEIDRPYTETNDRVIFYADHYLDLLYSWKEKIDYEEIEWPKDKRLAAFKELSKWLQDQFELVKSGKPHEVKKDFGDLNLPQWYIDSPNR